MATWNSRGLRGSTLEEMVNRTNEYYGDKGLALIQKIPTPITPVKMDKEHHQITLAYFEKRSTVDYIGAVQGIPVREMSFIICVLLSFLSSGAGQKQGEGKASALRSWTYAFS